MASVWLSALSAMTVSLCVCGGKACGLVREHEREKHEPHTRSR